MMILLYTLYRSALVVYRHTTPDTRTQCHEWLVVACFYPTKNKSLKIKRKYTDIWFGREVRKGVREISSVEN